MRKTIRFVSYTQRLIIIFLFFRQLEPDKNLVDQCVKGEGLVQINVQVRTASKRINIVDVLKPTDDVLGKISINRIEWLCMTG